MSTQLKPNVEAPPAPAPTPVRPRPETQPGERERRRRSVFDVPPSTPALRRVGTPRLARKVGILLIVLFIVTPILLTFIPWRQSVYGRGQVIGLHPYDRPFTVESPIHGQVVEYKVNEGDYVETGDVIAVVENIDYEYLETLKLIEETIQEQLGLYEQNVENYKFNLEQTKLASEQMVAEANAALGEAKHKIEETENKIEELKANLKADKFKFGQVEQLVKLGLDPPQDLVMTKQKYLATTEKLEQARATLRQAEQSRSQYEAKVKSTEAKQEAEIQKAEILLAEAENKVRETRNKLQEQQVKIRQQQSGQVEAPRPGRVLRILTNLGAGAQVKDGAPMVMLVPETPELAASIYLPGRDVPLVQEGDPVRLMFEGWPAVQFVGWPSVAVGTFPGKITLVDASDTKRGQFRVLVVPDMRGPVLHYQEREGTIPVGARITGTQSGASGIVEEVAPDEHKPNAGTLRLREITGEFTPDEPIKIEGYEDARALAASPWPDRNYLRQGAQAKGWVLLREVSLGFEIWRRLNGFPPALAETAAPVGKEEYPGGTLPDEKIKVKRPK